MLLDSLLLTSSLMCQVLAALLAVRLARITGWHGAWALVFLAVFLMAVRRGITLFNLLFVQSPIAPDRFAELVALLISLCFVLGLIWLTPLFRESISSLEASKVSEAQFRRILDTMVDVYYRTDTQGRLLMTSQASEAVFGYPIREIIGRRLSELYVDPSERERFLQVLESSGGEVKDFQAALRHKQGHEVWVSTNARYLRDASGRITGVEGISRDITDERQLRRRIQQVEKLKSVGQMAGGIAHDFNNLLQVIIGHLELIREVRGLPGDVEPLIDRIETASEKAAELVKQMLAFGKRRAMDMKIMALAEVVEDISGLLARISWPDVEVEVQSGTKASILGDRSALVQMVLNICLNARQAMPEGGRLAITSALEPGGPTFKKAHGWAGPGAYGVISVRDTGQGIPQQDRDRIFEPFFTTRKVGEGSGLGLAMAHGTIEEHGGAIEVDSVEGKGSEFRIYIPTQPADQPA